MNSKGFTTILSRQFKNKFIRFLLASLGISVGVWSISMTTSIAQGARETIYKAINNFDEARRLELMPISSKVQFGLTMPKPEDETVYDSISKAQVEALMKENPDIVSYQPQLSASFFLNKKGKSPDACFKLENIPSVIDENGKVISKEQKDVKVRSEDCDTVSYMFTPLEQVVKNSKGKIVGKKEGLKSNEILTCFKCGDLKLYDILGVGNPNEMVGKTITLTYDTGPYVLESGKELKIKNNATFEERAEKFPNQDIKTIKKEVFTIAGVVDDREESNSAISNLAGAFGNKTLTGYISPDVAKKAFELANPNKNYDNYGTPGYTLYANSFDKVKDLNDKINKEGKYYSFNPLIDVIKIADYIFLALTVVFGIFGLIALFASVFGIINLMIVSVLERQKEIGILKSLGAKNSSIFWLFLTEAMLLGVVGWLIGTITAFIMSHGIFAVANYFLAQNQSVKDAFTTVGINRINPDFPWWMLLSTLLVAIFFTTISGLIPALRAAKQNPADVMRNE